jgi:hypothetical protein
LFAIRWIDEEPVVKGGQSTIKLAWMAMKPSGPSEGVVFKSLIFLLLVASVVPDTSQATFAFYTACDEPEWSASAADGSGVYDCAWVADQLQINSRQINPAPSECSSDIPALDATLSMSSADNGGGEQTLWVAALHHCPTTCNQCGVTSRGCLGWDPVRKTRLLFAWPFNTENHLLIKTGSGQTLGKSTQSKWRFP